MKCSPINRFNAFAFAVTKTFEYFGLFVSILVTGGLVLLFRFGLLSVVMGSHLVDFFKSKSDTILPVFGQIFQNMTIRWWILAILVFIVCKLFQSMYTLGLTFVTLEIHDGKKVCYTDLFSRIFTSWKHVVASIIYYGLLALMVIPTFLLAYKSHFGSPVFVSTFIINSCIATWLAVRWWFFQHLIADKQYGPIKALRESWNLTSDCASFLLSIVFLLLLFISPLIPLSPKSLIYALLILPGLFLVDTYTYRTFVPKDSKK